MVILYHWYSRCDFKGQFAAAVVSALVTTKKTLIGPVENALYIQAFFF